MWAGERLYLVAVEAGVWLVSGVAAWAGVAAYSCTEMVSAAAAAAAGYCYLEHETVWRVPPRHTEIARCQLVQGADHCVSLC